MRKLVEKLLGYQIPKKLNYILQHMIVQNATAEEIANKIKKLHNEKR